MAYNNFTPSQEPIAIIGIACRFPGADNYKKYWHNLVSGHSSIEEIPPARWDWNKYWGNPLTDQNKSSSKWGGFLSDADCFDAGFFNLSKVEAESMDPQQRIMLELSWHCLEDAGIRPSQLSGSKTGVYLGVFNHDYKELLETSSIIEAHHATGTAATVVANRLSYYYNFKGPSLSLDSACSGSLHAIHLAAQSIQLGECELAMAGGVSLLLTPTRHISFSKTGMLSPTGKCKTFDDEADGYVRSEGAGLVLLKSLAKAQNDGDTIYGILKGSSVGHSGKTYTLTYPNPDAQAEVIRSAMKRAGIAANTISYIETHGTGTPKGDPIEFEGLLKAFKSDSTEANAAIPKNSCGLGSVKANIGHLESAAGIAGVIKVLLAMKHQKLPALLHFTKLNHRIPLTDSPFYIVDQIKHWQQLTSQMGQFLPRRAGVSSFGFGGTNAHVILEEASMTKKQTDQETLPAYLIFLSAKTFSALQQKIEDLSFWIEKEIQDESIADVSYTLLLAREHFEYRTAFQVSDLTALKDALKNSAAQNPGKIRPISDEKILQGNDILDQLNQIKNLDKDAYQNKLSSLAALYAQGYNGEWNKLFLEGQGRNISISPYPFAKTRYWLPGKETSPSVFQHPLLHVNTSTASSQQYTSTFSADEPFFKDHVIKGIPTLPGVVYLEMARAAVEYSWIKKTNAKFSISLHNTIWASAFTIDQPSKEIHIALTPKEHDQIAFEFFSQDPQGNKCVHCQGYALVKAAAGSKVYDLEAAHNRCNLLLFSRPSFYALLDKAGFCYGPSHQAVEQVYLGPDEVMGKLSLPDNLLAYNDLYKLHPGFMDAALQTAMAWLMKDNLENRPEKIMLPFAVQELTIYNSGQLPVWTIVRRSEQSKGNDLIHNMDITLCDASGNVCAHMKGYSARELRLQLQRKQVKLPSDLLLLEPLWQKQSFYHKDKVDFDRRVILLCDFMQPAGYHQNHAKSTEVRILEADETSIDKKFISYGGQVLEHIKRIIKERNKEKVTLQVVIPNIETSHFLAGLQGILKTATIEYNWLTTQLIEYPLPLPQDFSTLLLTDAREPNDYHIRYDGENRWVRGWQQLSEQQTAPIPWKSGGVYLITGGMGGLGYIFSEQIISQVNPVTLILTSRSVLSQAKQLRLDKLHGPGVKVIYRQVEVNNEQEVDHLFQWIKTTYGNLNGILHSAGIIRDNFIIKKSTEELQHVLAPKVTGLLNLDHASRDINLDFFVMFSSVMGVFGNIGQADYAMANAFMDQYAQHRNQLVRQEKRKGWTLSVNWPLWKSGGMQVNQIVEQRMARAGMTSMETQTGIAAFYQALSQRAEQVLIVQGDADKIKRKLTIFPKTPTKSKMMNMNGSLSHPLDKRPLQLRLAQLIEYSAQILQASHHDIDPGAAMDEYGFDSILYTQLANKLNEVYDLDISPTLFFEHSNLESLAGALSDLIGTTSAGQYQTVLYHPDPDATTRNLHHLSDEKTPGVFTSQTQDVPASKSGNQLAVLTARLVDFAAAILQQPSKDLDAFSAMQEYGFDSILYTRFANLLNDTFEIELSPTVFFEHESLEALAVYLHENHPATTEAQLPVLENSALPHDKISGNNTAGPVTIRVKTGEAIERFNSPDNKDLTAKTLVVLTTFAADLLSVSSEHLQPETGLDEYGFDSILYTALINRVNEKLDLDLAPTLFFEHTSLQAFAEHMTTEHGAALNKRWTQEFAIPLTAGKFTEKDKHIKTPDNNNITGKIAQQNNQTQKPEPIAIIGMSGKFPMAADLQELWSNLVAGKDCISEIPADRWDWKDYYGSSNVEPNKTKIKWGGFMQDLYAFDPAFFKLSPAEAEYMDPNQRLLLMYAWKVIEDAGYAPESLSASNTAVFAGLANHEFSSQTSRMGTHVQGYSATGIISSVGPNRVSYFLNLHGPSQPVETACSSSLIAIHRAVKAIQDGESDLAVAGGVQALLTPEAYVSFDKAGMLSETGRCMTFSDQANGYVRGEGVGMILLKSLKDAERDGDHIYGIIRSTAENHGGRANSLTAPNVHAQTELLKTAYRKAGIDPRTVGYIEAHGTGTRLGDPIEVNALKAAFAELYQTTQDTVAEKAPCGLGTIKTNVGHLEYAAGIAGVIKVVLQLQHRMLVKCLHSENINPYIRLEGSPFFVVQKNQEWKALHDLSGKPLPRRAGVSSFGFGGVNAHIVIEEYIPTIPERSLQFSKDKPGIFILSAQNKERLFAQAAELLKRLESQDISDSSLPSIAYTLQTGRNTMQQRLGLLAASLEELTSKLRAFLAGTKNIEALYEGRAEKKSVDFRSDSLLSNTEVNEGNYGKLLELWITGCAVDWTLLYAGQKPKRVSLPTYSFAQEHYRLPNPVESTSTATAQPTERAYALSNQPSSAELTGTRNLLLEKTKELLKHYVSRMLKLPPNQITSEGNLNEYGFDSVLLIQFTNELNEAFGLKLRPTVFYSHPNLETLASHLLENYEPIFAASFAIPSQASASQLFPFPQPVIPAKHAKAAREITTDSVAIIGISGRLPMSEDIDAFWQNLLDEKDCISTVPSGRWQLSPDLDPAVTKAGFIEDMDAFDPLFFNISPAEAMHMDPQQRLLLMHAYKAIEDAGYNPHSLAGSNTGVFTGLTSYEYSRLLAAAGVPIEAYSSTGMVPSMAPNRISFFLDLHGPSEPVETACSSSLVAIHKAVQAIQNGSCQLALAGGVNLLLAPELFDSLNKAGMLSASGHCKTFSDAADGYVRAEGVGMLMLKPLQDAEKDQDSIYGIIKSTALNHGGRASSLTAPNPKAQTQLLVETYQKANIDPATISYIEAHGTATPLGDPIEIDALKTAFETLYQNSGTPMPATPHCGIGSVKSNIGHMEVAAGIGGVFKVLMQLKHKTLVKSLHVQNLNPYIDLKGTPFYIVQKTQPWQAQPGKSGNLLPRRAAVSSFGFGGVNAHLVIEEYIQPLAVDMTTPQTVIIFLSAQNTDRLKEAAYQLLAAARNGKFSEQQLAAVAYTLQVGREPMQQRLAIIVSSIPELETALDNFINGKSQEAHVYQDNTKSSKKILDLFNQQGIEKSVQEWIEKLDYHKLADLWVKGISFDYTQLYGPVKPARISLPTYPFAKNRFWLKQSASTEQKSATPDPEPLPNDSPDHTLHQSAIRHLQATLADILQMPSEQIACDEPIERYGMDSIGIIRLVNTLKKTFTTLKQDDLYQHPTLDELANYLLQTEKNTLIDLVAPRKKTEVITRVFNGMIQMNLTAKGRPVFWMHPVSGGIECYQLIAEKCDRPFYAIAAAGWLDALEPLRGIPQIASHYIELIREVQPHGPYDLGGYSLGGALAYEMGRQLQMQGQGIQSIVMLDSIYAPGQMQKLELSYRSMALQTVNMLLLAKAAREPQQTTLELINRTELQMQTTDAVFLANLTAKAQAAGLQKTTSQLQKAVERGLKLQKLCQFTRYEVMPLNFPDQVSLYYFKNASKSFYGPMAAYCIVNEEENIDLHNIDYWQVWQQQTPDFSIEEIDTTSHITLLNDPEIANDLALFCQQLYSPQVGSMQDMFLFKLPGNTEYPPRGRA